MKFKINSTGNIVLADLSFMDHVHPGDYTMLPDDPVAPTHTSVPAFEFYRRLTAAERIAIRTLALTDTVAADFMHTLDNAIASGTNVRSDDPDAQDGIAYLSAHPTASPCLAAGRAAQIFA